MCTTPAVFWELSNRRDATAYSSQVSEDVFMWKLYQPDVPSDFVCSKTLPDNIWIAQDIVLRDLFSLFAQGSEWEEQPIHYQFSSRLTVWLTNEQRIVPQKSYAELSAEKKVASSASMECVHRYFGKNE